MDDVVIESSGTVRSMTFQEGVGRKNKEQDEEKWWKRGAEICGVRSGLLALLLLLLTLHLCLHG